MQVSTPANPYARTIAQSRRIRWDIDADVIRGRSFDHGKTFLPAGLSLADELGFLQPGDARLLSQVQGRTYANLFGVIERYIGAKTLDLGRGHSLGDQVAVEALVRMADEELKHQEMFRRLEELMAPAMPPGYRVVAEPNAVAQVVLSKGDWSILALTLCIELFTLAHYRASIAPREDLCPLWRDVFHFHAREEAQHAVLDEVEFLREDARSSQAGRDAGVSDLIALVGALDGILQGQAAADTEYFLANAGRRYDARQRAQVGEQVLKAYRWQYIVSGVSEPRFQKVLFGVVGEANAARLAEALGPLSYAAPAHPDADPGPAIH
ncbi:diiron oxygenase [Ramlibacter pallidus]|uniref:Diiron oxygenase n=1 Tax=Ramlibacter pallidus TaxID=2780087 RepID=A0ABR9S9X0_9BURK|nr:diiron oxygenase [Ramlibacter pallidus]MBE7369844.1 diiron oxygenase [Ramlibacter pallidus]